MLRVTKVFKCGNSQAVRIPKDFRLEGEEVYIKREGERIVLIPKKKIWKEFFKRLEREKDLLEDFLAERRQPILQEREIF